MGARSNEQEPVGPGPHWDDPKLVAVSGDSQLRRRYRRLQSWYRQEVLGLPPGIDSYGVERGNWLPAEAVKDDPSLNFLRSPRLAAIAEDRIAEDKGTVFVDRLRRNLLSSQPLAVNLFAPLLDTDPVEAAAVLQPVLHIDMRVIRTSVSSGHRNRPPTTSPTGQPSTCISSTSANRV